MVNTLFLVKAGARVAVLATALVQLGFAQMNGGMGGGMTGSGTPSNGATGMGSGMGGGMQGGMSGMGSGNGMMTSGPVVGSDGTAYVVRQAGGTSQQMMGGTQQATKTELVALNPQNGTTNWTLEINGAMISEPVLAKDGTIFLTTSEPGMNGAEQGGGMHSSNNSTSNTKPALVIITATVTSARVQNRVELDADVLSTPRITPDGQTIYVVATDMPNMTSNASTSTTGGSTLYAFGPAGNLKFKVQLAQFQGGQGR